MLSRHTDEEAKGYDPYFKQLILRLHWHLWAAGYATAGARERADQEQGKARSGTRTPLGFCLLIAWIYLHIPDYRETSKNWNAGNQSIFFFPLLNELWSPNKYLWRNFQGKGTKGFWWEAPISLDPKVRHWQDEGAQNQGSCRNGNEWKSKPSAVNYKINLTVTPQATGPDRVSYLSSIVLLCFRTIQSITSPPFTTLLRFLPMNKHLYQWNS